MSSSNVARAIRRLTERQLNDGYQLVNKINSTREKLLVGADQVISHLANVFTDDCSISIRNTYETQADTHCQGMIKVFTGIHEIVWMLLTLLPYNR